MRESEHLQDRYARLFRENPEARARYIIFQVTEACNLCCTYCYQGAKTTNSMSFDVAKQLIDELLTDDPRTASGCSSWDSPGVVLEFIGGEPLLKVELIDEITDYFISRCIELRHPWGTRYFINICTNGTLYFDPRFQEYIRKNIRHLSFNVTVDGNRELHDSCRLRPDGTGSYDSAIAAVKHWREHWTGSFVVRLLENMLSPGYSNKIQTTPVDDELQRLADNLGTEVLISDPDKDFSFEGTKYNLSAEQYEELATVRGQVAYGMLSDLMNDIGYSQLSDEAKAKAIENLVSYATYSARKSVMPEYDTDQNTWIEKCDGDESRVMYMAMMKALASEADITASNNSDFYSLILNTPWLGTTDQSYMLAQTWYLSGSYLTDSQHRGYQFLLDKEQREEVNYIYRTIFPNYFVEMVSTDEWWYAETMDEKLAMLKEVRDSSAAEARAIAQQLLRDAGVQSVPKQ